MRKISDAGISLLQHFLYGSVTDAMCIYHPVLAYGDPPADEGFEHEPTNFYCVKPNTQLGCEFVGMLPARKA
jgi:hypothetical protein